MGRVMRNDKRSAATQRGLWRGAYREFLRPRTIAFASAGAGLFVVAMTVFGPLGTSATLRPLPRLMYWGLSAAVTFPLCYGTAAMVLYLLRARSLVGTVPAVATAVLFEGMACTAVVYTADMLFRPEFAGAPSLGAVYLTVTTVVAVITFFVHSIVFQRIRRAAPAHAEDRSPSRAGSPPVQPDAAPAAGNGNSSPAGESTPGEATPGDGDVAHAPAEPPTARQARFYGRLSRAVSHDVIFLGMADHYVQVHTTGGSCLVLMNFATAVADLGDLGMRVHRSYWVARRHVAATVRRDGRTMLRMTGGHLVPVSRTYLPAVREALLKGARKRRH